MGQGWKVGENELGAVVETLGEGNLVQKQPGDLDGQTPTVQPDVLAQHDTDIASMKKEIQAMKLKLGMIQ